MPATAGMQAKAATPATSNNKDDNKSLTAHIRNASNIRNKTKSNNRTANTLRTPAKAGMLAKVVNPATA